MTESEPLETEPTFEEALSQLDRIVESLERGEPDLTSALAKYEKGVKLLTQCYRLLDQAEHSVALLTGVDNQGNPLTAPFDASATLSKETSSAPTPGNDANPVPGQRKTSERPSTRRTRSVAPASDGADSDPPF